MNSFKRVTFALVCTPVFLAAQVSSTAIPGVDEPPELIGPAKKFTSPDPIFKEFATLLEVDKWKEQESDPVKMKAISDHLTEFLGKHPDFALAYMMRAMGNFCFVGSADYKSIESDLANAFRYQTPHDADAFDEASLTAMRAKII